MLRLWVSSPLGWCAFQNSAQKPLLLQLSVDQLPVLEADAAAACQPARLSICFPMSHQQSDLMREFRSRSRQILDSCRRDIDPMYEQRWFTTERGRRGGLVRACCDKTFELHASKASS